MSAYRYDSKGGITVTRKTAVLDYAAGLDFLIDSLDERRGAYFSSGVEYPDRYSRWDFGFVDPPLELVARAGAVTLTALNGRGVRLLEILAPIVETGEGVSRRRRTKRRLELDVTPSARPFPEEERSRQPSAVAPLRALAEAFSDIDDGFLGLYGAFGYDLIFQFEPMAFAKPRDASATELHLYLPDQIYVLDRRMERALRHDFVFARDGVSTARAGRAAFDPMPEPDRLAASPSAKVEVDQTSSDFAKQVETARRHMIEGDVFELVLSREFNAAFAAAPSSLFRRFRELNPSPYEFYIQLGHEALVGASPEMFVRVEGDRIESCPIAGTIRRGADPMEDADLVRSLLNSDKDEAELTMCTDVDRNDKARICEPGSVRLIDRRLIERYAGLFHTVDHVEGRLRKGFTGIDAFLSHMWAVTLTGAPKRKAVELIEGLEAAPRQWYGGAIGGLSFSGGVNTGITIRTAVVRDGRAYYRAGASLVYDSEGAEEARETEIKATAFFRAVQEQEKPAAGHSPAVKTVEGSSHRVLMIDNEDSFVHCLADYFRRVGADVETYRWGLEPSAILAREPDLVVHSPGPGRPQDFGVPDLVSVLGACGVPQFGVCLGLQGIAEAFGGTLDLLTKPRHGKSWTVTHDGTGIFDGLPVPLPVGAYHSLHAPEGTLPPELVVTARNETGIVMGLHHREHPIAAVQFHPESILSMRGGNGLRLIGNVLRTLVAARADKAKGAAA